MPEVNEFLNNHGHSPEAAPLDPQVEEAGVIDLEKAERDHLNEIKAHFGDQADHNPQLVVSEPSQASVDQITTPPVSKADESNTPTPPENPTQDLTTLLIRAVTAGIKHVANPLYWGKSPNDPIHIKHTTVSAVEPIQNSHKLGGILQVSEAPISNVPEQQEVQEPTPLPIQPEEVPHAA